MLQIPSHFSPQTQAVISQRSKLWVRGGSAATWGHFLGAVSSFGVSDGRAVSEVRGIGMGDRFIELVPGYSAVYTISLERTMFYLSNLQQELGYRAGVEGLVRALRHHKYPFDIRQEIVFSEPVIINSGDRVSSALNGVESATLLNNESYGGPVELEGAGGESHSLSGLTALVTIYVACWLTDNGATYSTGDNVVSETSSVSVTDITDGTTDIVRNLLALTGNEAHLLTGAGGTGLDSFNFFNQVTDFSPFS